MCGSMVDIQSQTADNNDANNNYKHWDSAYLHQGTS